ncbi:unnamed protein product [Penicillium olsonii]|nr:unnamed protein product [Penicillium olsonii]
MDTPKQLPDQDRADRQPSNVPIPSDKAYPKVFSDSKPPTETSSKKALAIEQFQPLLETLADLDHNNPKLTFQAARTVGLYRHIWASYVPKHQEDEKPDKNNRAPKETNTKLNNKRDGLQHRPGEQLSHLYSFKQALGQTNS